MKRVAIVAVLCFLTGVAVGWLSMPPREVIVTKVKILHEGEKAGSNVKTLTD